MKNNNYKKWLGLPYARKTILLAFNLVFMITTSFAQRQMENLGRGVVAIRSKSDQAFISWRLLGTEPQNIGFNLYRSTQGGTSVKINTTVLIKGTNFTDNTVDLTKINSYAVRPVLGNVEQAASKSFTLNANEKVQPCFVIPIKPGAYIHHIWVGDLDGDGEYDFVVDRIGDVCRAEGYLRNGRHLWTIDMGPNSRNQNGISPGSSTIDVGHWDGLNVYDLDGDGKAEVMLRGANGVTFGDGKVLTHSNNNVQFVSILNGMTGAERARAQLPNDYISQAGPMACQMGIGYLNGITPSLITFAKNRNKDGSFNRNCSAWDFDGQKITLKWKTNMTFGGSYTANGADGHNMRIGDFDGDGKDEVGQVGFVLNGNDGSLKYDLGKDGIGHGDRWFVGKMDPNRPGLQGYGIQQHSKVIDYYYDAGTGKMIWKNVSADETDVGRGSVGDVDIQHPGYEVWCGRGLREGPTNKLISSSSPYPNFRIWWDGDVLSENLNDEKIEKHGGGRLVNLYDYEGGEGSFRSAPKFYGDILGDWREEVVLSNANNDKLIIYTTNYPSDQRLYTLAHNPLYRNTMSVKGYLQSHMVDYYLGHNMTTPPKPNITVVGQTLDCNADIGGTATVDKCGRCVGGKTNRSSCSGALEAEEGCLFNGTVDNNYNGFLGQGFLNTPNSLDGAVSFSIHADQGGIATLGLRYANGGTTNRSSTLTINGAASPTNINFEPTVQWDRWGTTEVTVNLQQGNNILVLKAANNEGLPNLDQIGFLSTGLSNGNCIVTSIDGEDMGDEIVIVPNPSTSVFTLRFGQAFRVKVTDVNGRFIEDLGEVQNTTFGESYASGVYLMHISSVSKTQVVKLIKN